MNSLPTLQNQNPEDNEKQQQELEEMKASLERILASQNRSRTKPKKGKRRTSKKKEQSEEVEVTPQNSIVPTNKLKKQDTEDNSPLSDLLSNLIVPTLGKIENNLTGILDLMRKDVDLQQDAQEDQRRDAEALRKRQREALLEKDEKKTSFLGLGGLKKQASSFSDALTSFLTNIWLASLFKMVEDIFTDPDGFWRGWLPEKLFASLNPLIGVWGAFSDEGKKFIEQGGDTLVSMFDGIKGFFDSMKGGLENIQTSLNSALSILPGSPQISVIGSDTNNESDDAEIKPVDPSTPEITPTDTPTTDVSPMAQGLEGGGMVGFKMPSPPSGKTPHIKKVFPSTKQPLMVKRSKPIRSTNIQGFNKGGKITPSTGEKITGMGADTQLIAAQPGEVVMSKKATDYWGLENLLDMNKIGGGTNIPKEGSIDGFTGGGRVSPQSEKVSNIQFKRNQRNTNINLHLKGYEGGGMVEGEHSKGTHHPPHSSGLAPLPPVKEKKEEPTTPSVSPQTPVLQPTGTSLSHHSDEDLKGMLDPTMTGAKNPVVFQAATKARKNAVKAGLPPAKVERMVLEATVTAIQGVSKPVVGKPSTTKPTLVQPHKKPTSSQPSIPQPRRNRKVSIAPIPIPSASGGGSGSSGAGNGTNIEPFSPQDLNNPEITAICAIYNIVV